MGSHEEVEAVVIAHPADIVFPSDFEADIRPTLFICAELEHIFPDSDRDGGKEILERRGICNKFSIYRGVTHGFAVITPKIFIDGIRFEEMKIIRWKPWQWRKQKLKSFPFLPSFSPEAKRLENRPLPTTGVPGTGESFLKISRVSSLNSGVGDSDAVG